MMDWHLLISQLLNGLQLGLLLFLLASGLSLIFGIMDFINLSHGSFYMIGAFVGASTVAITGSLIIAFVVTIIASLVVGALVDILIARKLYAQDHLDHVLVTFGLILVFDTLAHIIWGSAGATIPLPDVLKRAGRNCWFRHADLPLIDYLLRISRGTRVLFSGDAISTRNVDTRGCVESGNDYSARCQY